MSRGAWFVVVAVVAFALGVSTTLAWVTWRDTQEGGSVRPAGVESTPETTVADAQPDESTTGPVPVEVPESGVAVTVTSESGESYCYVRDAFIQGGRRYVVLDYIELGADLGMSEDYEIINNNPKLRTFEVTGDSYIGAFWMAVELYGDAEMNEWDDYSAEGDWLGVPLAWDDLVAAVDGGTVNDYSYWFVRVDAGRVVRLINTYQD